MAEAPAGAQDVVPDAEAASPAAQDGGEPPVDSGEAQPLEEQPAEAGDADAEQAEAGAVEGSAEDAAEGAEGAAEDAAEGAEGAAEDAAEGAEGAAEDAAEGAEGAAEDGAEGAEGAAEDAAEGAEGAAEDVAEGAEGAAEDAAEGYAEDPAAEGAEGAAEDAAEGAEGAAEDATEGLAEDAAGEAEESMNVEQLDVPATQLNVPVAGGDLMQDPGDVATKALRTVEGAISDITDSLNDIDDEAKRSSLEEKKSQLLQHQASLKQIISNSRPDTGNAGERNLDSVKTLPPETPQADSTFLKGPAFAALQNKVAEVEEKKERTEEMKFEEEVQDIMLVRRQLNMIDDARPIEEAPTGKDALWYDHDKVEAECAELRRVRNQIRYLFGGPDGTERTDMTVTDLLSEMPFDPQTANVGYGVGNAGPLGAGLSPVSQMSPFAPQAVQQSPFPAEAPPVAPQEVQEVPKRPPSHAGSQASYSSASTWNSRKDDDERRKERKEKKHRRRRDDAEQDRSSDKPKSNDAGSGLNWAEEVVKASMDPQNQWEFPSPDAGGKAYSRPPRARGQPSWEQPRQVRGAMGAPPRSGDVAAKARERAEEVMKKERELVMQKEREFELFGR